VIQFTKMHGLGNDFIFVAYNQVLGFDVPTIASHIAHRNTGIGCDQFIVYKNSGISSLTQMWIYNPDGSIAGACGNAMRCIAKLLYMQYGYSELEVDILGRRILCRVVSDNEFEINMGSVSFDKEWMPPSKKIWDIIEKYSVRVKEMICADIGNRHMILFFDEELSEERKSLLGSVFDKGPIASKYSVNTDLFPDGVNVNFANIIDNKVDLTVWEHCAGFTSACGSGACVTVAAAYKLGLIASNAAKVHFASGVLDISVQNDGVYMSGPATFVASGEFVMEQME
jgi:diaminopimelate epimerase